MFDDSAGVLRRVPNGRTEIACNQNGTAVKVKGLHNKKANAAAEHQSHRASCPSCLHCSEVPCHCRDRSAHSGGAESWRQPAVVLFGCCKCVGACVVVNWLCRSSSRQQGTAECTHACMAALHSAPVAVASGVAEAPGM